MSGSPVRVDSAGSEPCTSELSAVVDGYADVGVGSSAAELAAFDVSARNDVDLKYTDGGI